MDYQVNKWLHDLEREVHKNRAEINQINSDLSWIVAMGVIALLLSAVAFIADFFMT